jgi:excisionase family DNA binding protein
MAMLSTRIDPEERTLPRDRYLDLPVAARYTAFSVRTIRSWLTHPEHPLPCYRVGGKILLRRSELDQWLAAFRQIGRQDLDALVDGLVREFQPDSNEQLGGHRPQVSDNKGRRMNTSRSVAAGLQIRPSSAAEGRVT